ncbi:MAG: S41 family peptidase [Bacteroidales bacterium]
MKIKKPDLLWGLLLLGSLPLLASCSKDEAPEIEPNTVTQQMKVNNFIVDCMNTYYLWNNALPEIEQNHEEDSQTLFYRMVYKDDYWSFLTDDAKSLTNTFAGTEKTFGYGIQVYKFSNNEELFAVVQFVYDNLPAKKAGLKRGDIILTLNGNALTKSNYSALFSGISAGLNELGLGELSDNGIKPSNKTVTLQAVDAYQDPIITRNIIRHDSHTVGYLHYASYTLKSLNDLGDLFTEFKNAGITDLVLDLRYNSGGYALAAKYIASSLVRATALDNKSIYLQEIWNQDIMDYYASKQIDPNEYFTSTERDSNGQIIYQLKTNLNLERLFVLTGKRTASASEATIVGLEPYIDVIKIGQKTSGKYCGGIVFTPANIYSRPDQEISEWGIYAMVYRFANKNGETNFIDGFKPDYEIEDDYLYNPLPLGDEKEPMLAKALSLITGNPVATTPKRVQKQTLQPIEVPSPDRSGMLKTTIELLPLK